MTIDKYAADREDEGESNLHGRITQLVKDMMEAELRIKEAEIELKKRTAIYNTLKFKTLPDLFAQMGGVDEIVVNVAGMRIPVTYEEKMAARLSEAKKDAVFAEMKAAGQEHMVNSDVVVSFTRGQQKQLKAFMALLEKYQSFDEDGTHALNVMQTESIAPSTYTAWCDKNLRDRPDVNLADFGAHLVKQVKLGKPKTSKR